MDNLWLIIGKADNVPIVMMIPLFAFYSWLAFKQATANDRLIADGKYSELQAEGKDRIFTWPLLTRNEFLCAILIMVILTVWSVALDAPLEQPANPTKTPNPSKAPWYFLGLQEMLVYFDPWLAGVVFPTLIIVGLMAIPYIDKNSKGNGYYTWQQRKFAISTFVFGFFALWLMMTFVGTFLRGPGWNFFMPWDRWDPHKVVAMTNVDLHQFFGIRSSLGAFFFGGFVVTAYFSLGAIYYFWKKNTEFLKKLGPVRFGILIFLFLSMMSLPIKMILRWTFNIKYIWVTPWFNI
ncbi:cytochrome C [candidate division KSB1 bacterium]|nr:cytochrome C [candidate division KSB1 bacterium]MCH8956876.1 cytochrome C [candidate division KSB1 bacterium]